MENILLLKLFCNWSNQNNKYCFILWVSTYTLMQGFTPEWRTKFQREATTRQRENTVIRDREFCAPPFQNFWIRPWFQWGPGKENQYTWFSVLLISSMYLMNKSDMATATYCPNNGAIRPSLWSVLSVKRWLNETIQMCHCISASTVWMMSDKSFAFSFLIIAYGKYDVGFLWMYFNFN